MIGLDTNVVLRIFDLQSVLQRETVLSYIEEYSDEGFFINHVVLIEFVWVLRSTFKLEKEKIILFITRLLSADYLTIEDVTEVRKALEFYKNGNADFSDYLIAVKNEHNLCKYTVTFDKKAFNSLSSHFKSLTH
jgi:predicted nucleic-acid-binding protein